ncbi:MAG: hypothetical protein AAGH46_04060 [Bacteroidota bacterium]
MSKHRNSLENPNDHHLYQIDDLKEKCIFKYGISDDPIDEDGLSRRIKRQVNYLNLVVGYIRFVGEIILRNIAGRKKAKDIEDKYIDDHIDLHGFRPRGNPTGGKKHKPNK